MATEHYCLQIQKHLPCFVLPCFALLCFAVPCSALRCCDLLCSATWCHMSPRGVRVTCYPGAPIIIIITIIIIRSHFGARLKERGAVLVIAGEVGAW